VSHAQDYEISTLNLVKTMTATTNNAASKIAEYMNIFIQSINDDPSVESNIGSLRDGRSLIWYYTILSS